MSCLYVDSESNKIVIYTNEGTSGKLWDILRQHGVENQHDFDIQEAEVDVDFLVRHGAKVFRNDGGSAFATGIEHGSVACLAVTDSGSLILLTAKHVFNLSQEAMREEGEYWSQVGGEGAGHGPVSHRYYGVLSQSTDGPQPHSVDIAALPLIDDVTSVIRSDALYTMKQPFCGTEEDDILDCPVWKIGAITQVTHGRVVQVNYELCGQEYFAVESLEETAFAEKGDSGALVWYVRLPDMTSFVLQ